MRPALQWSLMTERATPNAAMNARSGTSETHGSGMFIGIRQGYAPTLNAGWMDGDNQLMAC